MIKLKNILKEAKNPFIRTIESLLKDLIRKEKYIKDAIRNEDWHEIQDLGMTLESMGKSLQRHGVKAKDWETKND